ncbi:MAG: hypothetical protein J6D54_05965 [Olsenella sp.]|nr:hypothetical protein [Olsenella sp.]
MAELPRHQALTDATGDAFRSSRLDRMLSNFAASYKLYWLRSVVDEAIAGSDVVPLRCLAARMVALAWYPVTYFRLNLGASDRLARTVMRAHEVCDLRDDATERQIRGAVLASDDHELRRRLDDLCNFVPYRLIRPFYADRLNEEKARLELSSYQFEQRVNRLIIEYNGQDRAGAPYGIVGDAIELDRDWSAYFRDNRHVVQGWLDMRLVDYLQARNPSVPAIPLKIHPPQQRNLSSARAWWLEALADHEFREIYTDVPFTAESFEAHGPMSIDHFIPWSFVLHDEPWNLAPMFRDTNSSKGNQLPDVGAYLRPLCDQQFDALTTLRGRGRRHRRVLESYSTIDPHVWEYDRTDAARESFARSVSRVVLPLHQIATNQGFPTWRP